MRATHFFGPLAALWLGLLSAACAGIDAKSGPVTRDPRWAVPMALPGLPNLHKVSPSLYRGAQPEPKGFLELERLGIKTVISLREHHDDSDDLEEVGSPRLELVSIPIDTARLNESHMAAFLSIVTDPLAQPVFVHCRHGADRTGTAVAVYRMVVEGWSKAEAIEEMRHGGYGFHEVWKNLPAFLEKLDVAALKNRLAGPPAPAARE